MRKAKNLLFIINIFILFLTACNNHKNPQLNSISANSSESSAPIPTNTKCVLNTNTELTLEQIAYANTPAVLLQNYKSIYSIANFKNGKHKKNYSRKCFLTSDENGYIYHIAAPNNNTETLKDRMLYTKDAKDNFYITSFIQNTYEQMFLPKIENLIYSPCKNEQLISYKLTHNIYQLKTKFTISKPCDDISKYWDISNGTIYIKYQLDAKTLFICNLKAYFQTSTDTTIELLSIKNTPNKNYQLPDYIKKLENPVQTRTIILIIKEENTSEEIIEYTIPKNAFFSPFLLEDYQIYEDYNYTKIYSPENIISQENLGDITYYIKKNN